MDSHSTNFSDPLGRRLGATCASLEPVLVTFSTDRDDLDVSVEPTNFHALYSRYAEDVYRFAHWLTGNPDDAADITSEAFVRVWTAPEEPRMETVSVLVLLQRR